MMTTIRQYTDEERRQITQKIEDFFGFVQDVLDDPDVLDGLPQSATIELTPLREGDEFEAGVVRSRRFAISVVESGPEDRRTQNT